MLMYARSVRGVRDDFVLDRVRIHCFECLGHSAVCFIYIYTVYVHIFVEYFLVRVCSCSRKESSVSEGGRGVLARCLKP